MDFLSLLSGRVRRDWPLLAGIALMQTVTALATLFLPTLNARIIDVGVAQGDLAYIWRTGLIMVVVAIIQFATAAVSIWCGVQAAMRTGRHLRSRVFHQVSRFSARELSEFGAPTLITRNTNDVNHVQMTYLVLLNMLVPAPLMLVGGIVMALREDAGLSWLVVVSVIALVIAVGIISARLMPLFARMQVQIDSINGVLREQIAGVRVVRAFTREDYERERFDEANQAITRTSLRVGNLFVTLFPTIMIILNVASGAVLWFGGHRVSDGALEVGALTAFLQYLLQILAAVMMGAFVIMMLPRAIACARRVREVVDCEPSLTPAISPVPLPDPRGIVAFNDVTFCYPGAEQPVLDHISFRALPGRTTALIGSTGSGKTTVLNLLTHRYAPSSGTITLDGVPVGDLSEEDRVRAISLTPQRAFLFSGTVASNLRIANPAATDAELWEALDIAQADFVREHGLDMPISAGGTNVSGGQRQRLCIARMLVARPRVYLFDDSFSALDAVTDARLRTALSPRTADATVIIVAQRVASIRDADQIIVLDGGRVEGCGTHDELLASCPTYQEIVASQESQEV